MSSTYKGTVVDDIIHVIDDLGSDKVKIAYTNIEYVTWGGGRWTAKREGNMFIHTSLSTGETHRSNVISYIYHGNNWQAKLEGNTFIHSKDGNFGQASHPANIIVYQNWAGVHHTASTEGDAFLLTNVSENGSSVSGHGGDDTIYGNAGNNQLSGDAGDDKLLGNAGNDNLNGGDGDDTLIGDSEFELLFGPSFHAYSGFAVNSGGWDSFDKYPRQVADVNGDGRADIVGFGSGGVAVALGQADGTFRAGPAYNGSAHFAVNQGWDSFDKYPRQVADVNGDGRADIVGFGSGGVGVALGQANGTFSSTIHAYNGFNNGSGWNSFDKYPRQLADVNGDGRADIVGFSSGGIGVALGQANGTFRTGPAYNGSARFAVNQGWDSFNNYPRQLADVNGDGRADIVGFGRGNVEVALGQANGTFGATIQAYSGFTANRGGWHSFDQYPRQLADVNGDGRADIVGFGSSGIGVAFGQANGTFSSNIHAYSSGFTIDNGGWDSFDKYPRQVADVNGDGLADIIGFSAGGVGVALSDGETGLKGGDDSLKGGKGNDILSGGEGNNTLWGGEGNDTFVLHKEGMQKIRDFERGSDKIDAIGLDFKELGVAPILDPDGKYRTILTFKGREIARAENAILNREDFINLKEASAEGPVIGKIKDISQILDTWAKHYAEQKQKGSFQVLMDNVTVDSKPPALKDIQALLPDEPGSVRVIQKSVKNVGNSTVNTGLSYDITESIAERSFRNHQWKLGGSFTYGVETTFSANLVLAEASTKHKVEFSTFAEGGQTWGKSLTETKNKTQKLTENVTVKPNSVATLNNYVRTYDLTGKSINFKVNISGDVGIDFDGNGVINGDDVSVPISAILQYYNANTFKGEHGFENNKLLELPTGETVVYTDTTTLTASLRPAEKFDVFYSDAHVVTSQDHDLANLSGNQLNERVTGLPGTDRFWLVRDSSYSDRGNAELLIDGFSPEQDRIGIDYVAPIDNNGPSVKIGPDQVLIAAAGGQDISHHIFLEAVEINGAVSTKILMGGTGDSKTSLADNDVLATVVGHSPDKIKGSFLFNDTGTVFDDSILQGSSL